MPRSGGTTTGPGIALVASIVVTVGLYYVPYGRTLGWPLVLLSTLAHELGHGLTAMAVGAEFQSFRLFADASGVAIWSGRVGGVGRAMIAAGGLVGPAIVAAGCFWGGRSQRWARVVLGVVALALGIIVIVVVRNLFGALFVGGVAAVAGWIALTRDAWASQVALVFVGVQLALSVFSRGDYLFTEVAHTASGDMPSDVAQMADALFGPYWLWGGACGAFSLMVLAIGVLGFLEAVGREEA